MVSLEGQDCVSASYINVSYNHPAFLSFINAARSKTPAPKCPIVIMASRGQRINVSITDFDYWQISKPQKQRACSAMAVIGEAGSDVRSIPMCALNERYVSVYTSHADTITVHFLFAAKASSQQIKQRNIIIQFSGYCYKYN